MRICFTPALRRGSTSIRAQMAPELLRTYFWRHTTWDPSRRLGRNALRRRPPPIRTSPCGVSYGSFLQFSPSFRFFADVRRNGVSQLSIVSYPVSYTHLRAHETDS